RASSARLRRAQGARDSLPLALRFGGRLRSIRRRCVASLRRGRRRRGGGFGGRLRLATRLGTRFRCSLLGDRRLRLCCCLAGRVLRDSRRLWLSRRLFRRGLGSSLLLLYPPPCLGLCRCLPCGGVGG